MHHFWAAGIAAVTFAALVTQFTVSERAMGHPGALAVVWSMLGYFTILTNLLVFFSFAAMALGRAWSTGWIGGLTLWIAVVGIIYHLLLAGLWAPVGLAWWADQGLHTAVPLLVLVYWSRWGTRTALPWRMALIWLGWPVAYCAYGMARGALTGFYPYPFLDVAALGSVRVAMNIGALVLGFILGGGLLVGLSRLRRAD